MRLSLRYDMRQPSFGASSEALYKAVLDQCDWADRLGFNRVQLGEHHGAEDGYLPSSIVLASAIAARTRTIEIHLSALLIPMHHPLRLAEDLAVADIVSGGRLAITAGMGYRPHEFEMLGVDYVRRLKIFLDGIAVLQKAWTGEPFIFEGRTVCVTPKPLQQGGPRITMGGSTEMSARRAARMGLDYAPALPELYEIYREERLKQGLPESKPLNYPKPSFIFVTINPDRDWPIVAPHIIYTTNSYVKWATERKGGGDTPYKPAATIEELKKQPIFQVVTPEQCIAYCAAQTPNDEVQIQPLLGGLDPAVSWKSLELFETAVLPELRRRGIR